MTNENPSFEIILSEVLNKSLCFSPSEIKALLAITRALIGSASFSLRKVARRSDKKFSRNFLAKTLVKYATAQDKLVQVTLNEFQDDFRKVSKIFVLLDDTLIKKRGSQIFGSNKWFDHAQGRQIQSICLVNVAVVINDQVLFILPWLLLKTQNWALFGRTVRNEQDGKTNAGILLIQGFIRWFEAIDIPISKVVVMADAWFSSKTMMAFLKLEQLNCRIDSKKNYRVQEPDHEAIRKRNERRRGRKRKKFVKWTALETYLGHPSQWHYFTDSEKNQRVFYKTVIVTLKTSGRARVYAFYREQSSSVKFILTPAKRLHPPSPKTVYRDYQSRWRIEEAHRDLKQHFGIGKCQNRAGRVIHGFFGIVCLAYGIWKRWAMKRGVRVGVTPKCPTWAENYHHTYIRSNYGSMT
ncbi:MAG: transposase [Candidatus Babeliaceae bacterium]|nr:transposase [Candidatus Babeliaceae bacterium]